MQAEAANQATAVGELGRGAAGLQVRAAVPLLVQLQACRVEGALEAALQAPLALVQALVQLEVDVLGEAAAAQAAGVGLDPRVQAQVGLQVAGAAEALVADLGQRSGLISSAGAHGRNRAP